MFREFEVEVRPEPPPPPVAPDGRTAEDTLANQMGLGDAGTFKRFDRGLVFHPLKFHVVSGCLLGVRRAVGGVLRGGDQGTSVAPTVLAYVAICLSWFQVDRRQCSASNRTTPTTPLRVCRCDRVRQCYILRLVPDLSSYGDATVCMDAVHSSFKGNFSSAARLLVGGASITRKLSVHSRM